jgi:DNA-binding transcriptional LysR family regulator
MVRLPARGVDSRCAHSAVQACTAATGVYSDPVAASDDFDWDDLRYFLRAAQTRTLAGAARAMGVEHTTIGRRLTALEKRLGAALVLRGPEGLTLTPLGELLAPRVEDVERAVLAVRELATSRRERVRLSVPQALTGLFIGALGQLRVDHPDFALEIRSDNRPPDLKRGDADLAVLVRAAPDEDLVARTVGEVGWSLYAAADYLARRPGPVDPDDLSGHEIVGVIADPAVSPAAKWLAGHAGNATVVSRSNASASLVAAAVAGAGLALLPCFVAEGEATLKRLTPAVLVRHPVLLVYRRELRLAESVRLAIRFVVDVMQAHGERLSGVAR